MLLDEILKVLNGSSTSGMVGPSVGARNCCEEQLPMSVDDRENCNPSVLKPGSVSGESLCQVKISLKHHRQQPWRPQKNDLIVDLRGDCSINLHTRDLALIDFFFPEHSSVWCWLSINRSMLLAAAWLQREVPHHLS